MKAEEVHYIEEEDEEAPQDWKVQESEDEDEEEGEDEQQDNDAMELDSDSSEISADFAKEDIPESLQEIFRSKEAISAGDEKR